LVLQQKRGLLEEADSMYKKFLDRTRERLNAGDVDMLELSTAENQRQQIANQLQMLNVDYKVLLNRLSVLINMPQIPEPLADSIVYPLKIIPDTSFLNASPFLKYRQHLIELSETQQLLEKRKLYPTFNAGFNTTTIIGWQATGQNTEQYFSSGKRFNSVTAGIGVPLFSKAQRSRINAAEVLSVQRRQELDAAKQQLNTDLNNALTVYQRDIQLLQSYRKIILPGASSVISTATNKLNAGEIGYLNWVILVNQAIQSRTEYYNTVHQLNEAAIEIERISALN
jgi:cobalt-zinc-cadmium resistance protein CzcA